MPENKKSKPSPDTIQRAYWRRKEVFADFFNAYLFNGREVIKPQDLAEKDTDSSAYITIGDTDTAIQGARDNLQTAMTCGTTEYAIIGIEDQNYIHYAMPFMIEEYDVVTYNRQYKRLKDIYKGTNELNGNELMSGIKKTDRFTPVVTVVVYFGSEPWDTPKSLHEMMDIPTELKPYVNDFKINLVEVRDNNLVFNNKDNKDMFTLLKIIYDNKTSRKEKRKQLELYSTQSPVDETVLKVIASTTNMDMDIFEKEEEVTVCKLWEEVKAEGKAEGRAEGKAEGRARINKLISILLASNRVEDLERSTKDRKFQEQLLDELVPEEE